MMSMTSHTVHKRGCKATSRVKMVCKETKELEIVADRLDIHRKINGQKHGDR